MNGQGSTADPPSAPDGREDRAARSAERAQHENEFALAAKRAQRQDRFARPADRVAGRRLIVIRHGETDHNANRVWQGQLDTELSLVGREQAAAAASAIGLLEPVAIRSSDLRRAAQTAGAVASRCALQVHHDERLREIDVGQWEGLTAGDIAERYPDEQAAIDAGEDLPRGVDGETVAQVAVRASAAAREFAASLADGEIGVIVTHGVAARALVADLVAIDQYTAWMSIAGLHNCAWAELREYPRGWRVAGWNLHA